jgi:hypothetical protein
MKKYKFQENIWVSFSINGKQHVGRTLMIDGLKLVATVSEDGKVGHIYFDALTDIKQINFLGSQERNSPITESYVDKTGKLNEVNLAQTFKVLDIPMILN